MALVSPIRLGVNVDHVATLRQARGTPFPDPVEAALIAASAGAEGITIHLREDRRHIQEHDLERLLPLSPVPVNLEMAVTVDMVRMACAHRPSHVCLVPEKREERTTEGGLDVVGHRTEIREACAQLSEAGIKVALFIDPEAAQLEAARGLAVPHIEIHTGAYADALTGSAQAHQLQKIATFAHRAAELGFEVHAGHGLNIDNVAPVSAIPEIVELNIGHALIARSVFLGLPAAVAEMRRAMIEARGR